MTTMNLSKVNSIKRLLDKSGEMEHVKRYSIRVVHEKQSVAAHSALVGVVSCCLGEFLNDFNDNEVIDIKLTSTLALFHDLEETDLGDILLTTKKNKIIKTEYDILAKTFYNEFLNPVRPDLMSAMFDESLTKD